MPTVPIAPNTNIMICRGVPFDNSYEHTFLPPNQTAQTAYFLLYVKITATSPNTQVATYRQHTYQRTNSNAIRIDAPIQDLYDCNYLAFSNDSYENKIYYAFITQINYINDNCTEIVYELDVIQTYMFDYEFEDCYIERQHTPRDDVFGNTVPENLEIGDYVYKSVEKSYDDYTDFVIDIVAPFSLRIRIDPVQPAGTVTVFEIDKNIEVGFYNQFFSGLIHNTFEISAQTIPNPSDQYHPLVPSTQDIAKAFGTMLESDKEQIVAIYMLPKHMAHPKTELPSDITHSARVIKLPSSTAEVYGTYTDAGGNVHNRIKNNKLLTYPYNLLMVQDSEGKTAEYKYELFWQIIHVGDNYYARFNLIGTMGLPPQLMCCPQNYKPYDEDSDNKIVPFNYVNNLTITQFPMSGWATNGFAEWLANKTTGLAGGLLGTMLAPGIGTVIGAGIGAFAKMSFAATAYGSISSIPQALIAPNYAHGVDKNSLMLSLNEFGFHFYNARIKDEYALIIDDYFTKYGYAIKRIGKPNLRARPKWTYVETKNCAIKALSGKGINAEHMKQIEEIYDHGITFWQDADIGNYSLDNSPVA